MSLISGFFALRALSGLINDSIDKIETAYVSQHAEFPALKSTSKDPIGSKRAISGNAARTFCNGAYLAELYRTGNKGARYRTHGERGLDVGQIAKFSPVNSDKLARCLRTLATNYIFREVAPNVFANNRLSVLLDTGKDAAQLAKQNSFEQWFDKTDGTAAMFYLFTDFNAMVAHETPSTLMDPILADSYKANEAPSSRVFGKNVNLFQWLGEPQNAGLKSRFHISMAGAEKTFSSRHDFILHEGLGWDKLPAGSTVVDVGGGVGTHTLRISEKHRDFRFVVQDLPEVIEHDAKKYWQLNDPKAIEEGRVELMSHSFFEPNPVKGASVYLLHQVIHNWPDDEALTILRHIQSAANPESKIIATNFLLIPPVSVSGSSERLKELGIPTAPEPLLPNFGPVSGRAYFMDQAVLGWYNAMERTIDQWFELIEKAGLHIDRIVGDTVNGTPVHIVCSKV